MTVPKQPIHIALRAVAEADDRWRAGVVERVEGDRVVVSYLDGSHAVIRLREVPRREVTGVVEVNQTYGFVLAGMQVLRADVVLSTSPSIPPSTPGYLVPFPLIKDHE